MQPLIVRSDQFALVLPPGHRFPFEKYVLLRQRCEAKLSQVQFTDAEPVTDYELTLVHERDFVDRAMARELTPKEERALGIKMDSGIVRRALHTDGATIRAAEHALDHGLGVNLAGGSHHAFADRAEGFCVFNDVAIAIRLLQRQRRIRTALIIDLDVHQGNGTAAIFADDSSVFTFSAHGANNYPLKKVPSDLDLPLPDNCRDDEYLAKLDVALAQLPWLTTDLVFYLAGADPHEGDKLGRLALTKNGLAQRDQLVYDAVNRHQRPLCLTMAGGYGLDIHDTVDIQFTSVRLAVESSTKWAPGADRCT